LIEGGACVQHATLALAAALFLAQLGAWRLIGWGMAWRSWTHAASVSRRSEVLVRPSHRVVTERPSKEADRPFGPAPDQTTMNAEPVVACAARRHPSREARRFLMTASSRGEVGAASRTRFSTPLLVSIIAIVVIGVVAIAFILFSGSGTGPVASDSPEPTATTETTPIPTLEPTPTPTPPTPSPEPSPTLVAGWTGLNWSDPVTPSFVVHLKDLVAWGDGYVAVGEVVLDATRNEAAFLTSPDGLNWSVRYQVDPGADRFPRHLVILGDELLAFSHPNTDALGLPGASESLVWRSADGMTWSAVDSQSWRDGWSGLVIGPMPAGWDDLQHPIPTGLVDVASGPAGLVAIGNSYGADGLVPVVLHATDGRDWSPVRLPADAVSPLLSAVVPYDGGFVLVGAVEAGPRADSATPAAWFSADGAIWLRATVDVDAALFPDGLAGIGEIGDVTVGAEGLVGWWGQRGPTAGGPQFMAAWTSADGRTWEPRDLNAALPHLAHAYVAGDGVRIVALGPAPSTATDPALWPGLSQAWISNDGVSWTTLSVPRELYDFVERMWVVPDGVIYAGVESFWFGSPTVAP